MGTPRTVRRAPGPITVTLPDLPTVPQEYRGEFYTITRLLADGDSNFKLAKSQTDLYHVSASAWPRRTARATSCAPAAARAAGRPASSTRAGGWCTRRRRPGSPRPSPLSSAGTGSRSGCKDLGVRAAFRLNVLSDVRWESVFPWLFTAFPTAQYYDYSKHAKRALRFARGRGPANYHLTFSRSEKNERECLQVLKAGGNVTVVFRSSPLPATWRGYRIIDGDQTDLRFLDPRQVVVGLSAKGTGKHDTTGFVVDADRLALPVVS
jgi:hypothetical protein